MTGHGLWASPSFNRFPRKGVDVHGETAGMGSARHIKCQFVHQTKYKNVSL